MEKFIVDTPVAVYVRTSLWYLIYRETFEVLCLEAERMASAIVFRLLFHCDVSARQSEIS